MQVEETWEGLAPAAQLEVSEAAARAGLLEKFQGEREHDGVIVVVRQAPRGRVTGWSVACPDHGAMPLLAPCRKAAILAADRHVRSEHGGLGQIDASARRRKRTR
jgi:hypothetical protein